MKKIFKILIIAFFVFISVNFARAESFPEFPMAFYGKATLNGANLPNGTIIRAYYGTELAGEIRISSNGIYGYSEPIKQKLLVKSGVGAIIFKYIAAGREISGDNTVSYPQFLAGTSIQKNLDFIVNTPVVTNGNGGGGNSTLSVTQHFKKGDFNGDGFINIADFNGLMVEWGRQGGKADFNGDGRIDIYDFNFLMINWNK